MHVGRVATDFIDASATFTEDVVFLLRPVALGPKASTCPNRQVRCPQSTGFVEIHKYCPGGALFRGKKPMCDYRQDGIGFFQGSRGGNLL